MLTLALKADFSSTKQKITLKKGSNIDDLKKIILSKYPEIKTDLFHLYELFTVSYLSDVIELDLMTNGTRTLTEAGIQNKSTIIISTPVELRLLQSRPLPDDDDNDEDDENKKTNPYEELTDLGVLEKLIKGVEDKDQRLLLRYFDIYAKKIVLLDRFLDLPKGLINKIVKRNKLNIPEKDLFSALIKWGKAECKRTDVEDNSENLRQILKDEVPYIRFPTMSLEDVASIVLPTHILSQEEILQIYLFLGTKENQRNTIQVPFHYKVRKPRKAPNFFNFKWSKSNKHRTITLSNDDTVTSTDRGSGWQSIFADKQVPDKGVFQWSITLDEYDTRNTYNVVIGVVPSSFSNWSHNTFCGFNTSSTGWTFITGNGMKCHNGEPVEYSDIVCNEGDKIGVKVDMFKNEISFLHNGRDLGVAWDNVSKSIRPCLSLVQQQRTTLKMSE